MCLHRSYVVGKDKQLYYSPKDDHHTTIRDLNKLPSNEKMRIEKFAAIECRPVHDLFMPDSWNIVVDEERTPDWWTPEHKAVAANRLRLEHKRFNTMERTYCFPGDLNLNSLIRMVEGMTIIAEGEILLSNMTFIPPNCTLVSKSKGIFIPQVSSIYDGVTMVAPIIYTEHDAVLQRCNAIETGFSRNNEYEFQANYNHLMLGQRRDFWSEIRLRKMSQRYASRSQQRMDEISKSLHFIPPPSFGGKFIP